jgi:hypothetical protein
MAQVQERLPTTLPQPTRDLERTAGIFANLVSALACPIPAPAPAVTIAP